jgi:hypothetical protein
MLTQIHNLMRLNLKKIKTCQIQKKSGMDNVAFL